MYRIYKGKVNELTFELNPADFIAGSSLVFMGKKSRRDPDSAAVIKASTSLGILYDPISGKGIITLMPPQNVKEGRLDCDFQMIAPTGSAYLIQGAPVLEVVSAVNWEAIA